MRNFFSQFIHLDNLWIIYDYLKLVIPSITVKGNCVRYFDTLFNILLVSSITLFT